MQKLNENGTLQQKLAQLGQFALAMAKRFDPSAMHVVGQIIGLNNAPQAPQMPMRGDVDAVETDSLGVLKAEEHPGVQNARAQAREATQPND